MNSRHRTLARTLAALLAGGVVATVLTAPAEAAPRRAAASVSVAAPKVVEPGGVVTVRGTVRSGRTGAARAAVAVQVRRGTAWRTLKSGRANARGDYAVRVRLSAATTLRVRTPTTRARRAGTSRAVKVAVRPVLDQLSPRGASDAVKDESKAFSGRVRGVASGHRVRLDQRDASGRWRQVATSRTRAGGRFELAYTPTAAGRATVRVVAPAAGGLSAAVGPALGLTVHADAATFVATRPRCLGAAAMVDPGCRNPRLDGLVLPTRTKAVLQDDHGATPDGCFQFDWLAPVPPVQPDGWWVPCPFRGPAGASVKVALVGDSHALAYKRGLAAETTRLGWRLDSYLGIACRWIAPGTEEYPLGPDGRADGIAYAVDGDKDRRCRTRSDDITRRLQEGDYDVVLYTGFRNTAIADPTVAAREAVARRDRYVAEWSKVVDAGTPVVVLTDNAVYDTSTLGCVTRASLAQALSCTVPRATVFAGRDPAAEAGRLMAKQGRAVRVMDLDPYFCRPRATRCPLVAGNVVVQRDHHHVSGTYAMTMAPFVVSRLRAILRDVRP